MKYYAVKNGTVPGIYTSWAEAGPLVQGFPGAEYKSFPTREEAERYMSGNIIIIEPETITVPPVLCPDNAYAFVDGSYNPATGMYGCGGFLVFPAKEGTEKRQKMLIVDFGTNAAMAEMRNVAGEIMGAQKAIKAAWALGFKKLTVFYDYEGIRSWADSLWKCNKEGTEKYRDFVRAMREKGGMEIDFVHVKGHSGIEGNEEADRLAKASVGI